MELYALTQYGPGGLIIGGFVAASIIIYFVRIGRSGSAKSSGPSLVLSKFEINPDTSTVLIVGRPGGLADWMLTLLGINNVSKFKASRNEVRYSSGSLFGELDIFAATPNISSVRCSLQKPFGYLMFGCLMYIMAVLSFFTNASSTWLSLVILCIGTIFFIAYALSKSITIEVETSGGSVIALKFKRSVIENVAVDINKARLAVSVISETVNKCHLASHQEN